MSTLTLAQKEQARKEALEHLYQTTGKTVKIVSLIGAIILTLVGFFLLWLGWYLIGRKSNYQGSIVATVQPGGTCVPIVTGLRTKYNCQVTVQYQVSGQSLVTPIMVQADRDLSKGGSLQISYNPLNYQDIQPASSTPWTFLGWLAIVAAILLIIFSWIGYWLIQKVNVPMTAEKLGEYWAIFR